MRNELPRLASGLSSWQKKVIMKLWPAATPVQIRLQRQLHLSSNDIPERKHLVAWAHLHLRHAPSALYNVRLRHLP